jgi:hypothetical protein
VITSITFGLRPPSPEDEERVVAQVRNAHRYRNVLIEIERSRRAAVRAALSSDPAIADLESERARIDSELEGRVTTVKAQRAVTRGRSEDKTQRAQIRELRARVSELSRKLKEAKRELAERPATKEALASIREVSYQRVREERAKCGVYWGTYLLQEAAMKASSRSASDPRFLRWTGSGRVGIQLQGGLDVDDAFGGDTQLQIQIVPDRFARPDRRPRQFAVLRIRVGSSGRAPIWAAWPMLLHRPLPVRGAIKGVVVSRRRSDCLTWRWEAHVTIDTDEIRPRRSAPEGSGMLALNLGWCARPGGQIRAGYLVGEDGLSSEVAVERRDIDAIEQCEAIRSVRDKNLNEIRAAIVLWLDQHEWPEALRERCLAIHAWRSQARFAALARAIGDHVANHAGQDPDVPELAPLRDLHAQLESWRYRDAHLEQYESHQRSTAIRRRRERYRILAARMAERYSILVVDDADLSALQRRPNTESEDSDIARARNLKRLAASGELRVALRNAFGGDRTIELSAKDVTRRHWVCWTIVDRELGERMLQCDACAQVIDQDENACRNLLAAACRERSGSGDARDAARGGIRPVPSLNPEDLLESLGDDDDSRHHVHGDGNATP